MVAAAFLMVKKRLTKTDADVYSIVGICMGGEDMTNKQKQTSIDEFKQFVRRHPKLIQEVQSQEKSWQSVYENWVMFGEEDEMWSPYRQLKSEDAKEEKASKPSETGKADFMSKMVSAVKKWTLIK